MAIQYKDLRTRPAHFKFRKIDYELRAFDLSAQVWAYEEFATEENPNGVEVLSDKIQDMNNFSPVLKCAWHLLRRKRDFGLYDNFICQIEKGDDDGDKYDVIARVYKSFVKTLGLSQPQLNEIQEDLELKKQSVAAS